MAYLELPFKDGKRWRHNRRALELGMSNFFRLSLASGGQARNIACKHVRDKGWPNINGGAPLSGFIWDAATHSIRGAGPYALHHGLPGAHQID